MPHIDGLTLVSALRDDVRTALVPVVLLSARAGGGLDRGSARRGRRLSGEAVQFRRTAGSVETNIALARQPACYLAFGTGAFAAGGVLRLRPGRRRGGDQRRLPESSDTARRPAPPAAVPWWPDPETQPEEHERAIRVYDAALQQKEQKPGDLTFAI